MSFQEDEKFRNEQLFNLSSTKTQNVSSNDEDEHIIKEADANNRSLLEADRFSAVDDLPHASAATQLWNFHGHLKDSDDHDYSIFISFSRVIDSERSTCDKFFYLHGLTWGVIDVTKQDYYSSSSFDRFCIRYLLNNSQLLQQLDKHLISAYQEVLLKGILPSPDRIFIKDCSIDSSKFYFDYDNNTFLKDENGSYHIFSHDPVRSVSLKLVIRPINEVSTTEKNGTCVFRINPEEVYSYFNPRLQCDGKIIINNQSVNVTGFAWYEYEINKLDYNSIKKSIQRTDFLNYMMPLWKSTMESSDYEWYRFSIQLDNKCELRVSYRFHIESSATIDKSVIFIGPNNARFNYDTEEDFELEFLKSWVSVRTTSEYRTCWKLSLPEQKCTLYIEAAFDNQEFLTIFNRSGLWKGRANVRGSMNNGIVNGYAFMECHHRGAYTLKSLDQFFKRISKIVVKNIDKLMPKKSNYAQILNLIGDLEKECLIDGLNIDIFTETIILPLRDIADRGGKAWRSYAFMVCIDCVGSDSTKYEHWLSLAEIVHVGSLIIDDIEDESNIRRGGPACHLLHGTAQAINAGTAAYFMPLHALLKQTPQLSSDIILRIYEITFLILRAGHIGQALDIRGLDYMMDDVVETGHSLPLEKAIICIHRLKSGTPAGGLAHMAALIGGGTKQQCEALAHYFQSIGIAFQIIDDVLNLRGFQENTKIRGEDIMAGKITFPIAKAMDKKYLQEKMQRKYVCTIIRSKPTDITLVNDLIQCLENCGSINASVEYAKAIIEDAWNELDRVIPNSIFKIMLRAFGLHILERHY